MIPQTLNTFNNHRAYPWIMFQESIGPQLPPSTIHHRDQHFHLFHFYPPSKLSRSHL